MQIGIISDIHGNDENLIHALNDLGECGRILNLGDSIGARGDSNEVIRLLAEKQVVSILGNHDLEILLRRPIASDRFTAGAIDSSDELPTEVNLSKTSREYLVRLKQSYTVKYNDRLFGFHHSLRGRFWNGRIYYEYITRDNAREMFDLAKCPVVFVGHQHKPGMLIARGTEIQELKINTSMSFRIKPDEQYIINVGSIGIHAGDFDYTYTVLDLISGFAKIVFKKADDNSFGRS